MIDALAVDHVLTAAVDSGVVPGVVALAADKAGVVYAGAFGVRELGKPAAMSVDTVFWFASMTKAITTVAAMRLVEQGAIGLDDPLGDLLPDLAAVQVLDGFDVTGAPRLRPPRRPVTLRHLLTHTAGFAYYTWNAEMLRYQTELGIPFVGTCTLASLRVPLVFDPGARWEYGIGIDWAGQAVERLTGQRLEEHFREQIFGPLGMGDTGFALRDLLRERLAIRHRRRRDGSLLPDGFLMAQRPEFYMGGGGLYGTGPDYLRFLRMLLGGGELDGVRILRPETVAEMGRNQIGELRAGVLTTTLPDESNDLELFPGMAKGWGLGGMITPDATPTGRSAGSLAWAGMANTYYWIDPTRRVTGVLLTQIVPFGDPAVIDLFAAFETAIYAELP
jgi:methyl acetate hydrolase